MSVFCTSLIKIKIAVDARRVAKRPETCIWVNADDQAVVNRPVVLAVAYGLADVNNAVLIDGDRHLDVVLQIVIDSADFLEIILSSRNIVEQYLALVVGGERYVDIVVILRCSPESEDNTGNRHDLAGGLVDLGVDLQDLDISDLTEADLRVILVVAREIRKFRIFSELHRVEQVNIVIRDGIVRLALERLGRFHEHGHGDRGIRFENVVGIGRRLAQVDSERGGVFKRRIVGIGGLRPDVSMIGKYVVRGDIERFNTVAGKRSGIIQFPGDTALGKHRHIEAPEHTVPLGGLVVDGNIVLEGVDQDHIPRPGRRVGSKVDLVTVFAAADRGGLVRVSRVAGRSHLLVKAQIARGQDVERALGLGIDELIVISIRVKIDQILTVGVRGSAGGAAVVRISVADVNVAGLIHDAVEHIVSELGDAVPGMVGRIREGVRRFRRLKDPDGKEPAAGVIIVLLQRNGIVVVAQSPAVREDRQRRSVERAADRKQVVEDAAFLRNIRAAARGSIVRLVHIDGPGQSNVLFDGLVHVADRLFDLAVADDAGSVVNAALGAGTVCRRSIGIPFVDSVIGRIADGDLIM